MTTSRLPKPHARGRVGRRAVRALVVAGAAGAAIASGAVASGVGGAPARPARVFDGDFQPGTLRPWDHVSLGNRVQPLAPRGHFPAQISVVRAPFHPHLWAARFAVSPQQTAFTGSHYIERTELAANQAQTDAYPGRSAWYGWATYFPRGFKATPGRAAIVAQAYHIHGPCSWPNLAMVVDTDPAAASAPGRHAMQLVVHGGAGTGDGSTSGAAGCPGIESHTFSVAHFRAHHWFRFALHVMWSSDPAIGYVELWVDGTPVIPLTHLPTLYAGSPGAYWKQGLYEYSSPYAASDYELGLRVGPTYPAVAYSWAPGPPPMSAP